MSTESSSSCDSFVEVLDEGNCRLEESMSSEPSISELSKPSSSSSSLNSETLSWKRGAWSLEDSIIADPPWYISIMVKLSCTLMFLAGVFADWLRMRGFIKVSVATDDPRHKGFAPLDHHFEAVYINHIYRKSSDVVNRPIASVPASVMLLKDRYTDDYGWTQKYTGTISKVINMGSYNYLGFSHNDGPCAEEAARYIDKYGLHIGSTRHERGNHVVQAEIEKCVARYLGVEAAICFPMGFGTNSMNIPSLVDKRSLILSDELNHASLVLGCRVSGATVKVFKHNNAKDCEKKLRDALCHPSPKTGKPFNKVLIVIEGIYSMEGTIVNLPEFIRIKKKYGAYLFLDEAHSVGALGPTGKGVVEYWGCNARDVDIMMGTLTKSFAAAGGYMGGTKAVVEHIRRHSAGPCYGTAMSPPIIAQVLSSMKIMCGEDGTDIGARKAVQLLKNSRYFRRRLKQMGFLIYGHEDSPVVPLMTFYITKVVQFSRRTLEHDIGLVAVGFPATPLTKARVRFCLSADHTKEQLDYVLDVVDKVGDETSTKYGTKERNPKPIEY
uniref:Aminotran_1_2 domain-containing protein n=1 Tax=Haemonchus contortus TaxID=6289 RepID=A0A7I4YVN6_HAECO